MRTLSLYTLVALPLAVLSGCAGSPPEPKSTAAPPAALPAAQTVEKEQPSTPAPRPAKRERPPAERAKVAQLFQVPQVTRTSGSYAEARQEGASMPHIRLLGFSRMDGQLRAIVQVKNETLPVEQGDIIDGVKVVALDEGGVSFQYAGQRWTSQLIEKPESRPVIVARAPTPNSADSGSAAAAPSVDPSSGSSN